MKQEIQVEGMSCAGCAETVKQRFEGIPEVNSVEIDLENKKAILDCDGQVGEDELVQALEGTNYNVVHSSY